ncbi:MAG: hypothetical protein NZ551_11130 [Microscillaceae bacterium]|nr:hypothetical protein [Microscillaceae bacterium]MDW8461749.1 hypothetical protein [Cytophagales bacterium]
MQIFLKKKYVFFIFSLFFHNLCGQGTILVKSIQRADSLFTQKQYGEALEIYEYLLQRKQRASPQTLLKMAFITEGLNDYPKTLYYLSLYYYLEGDYRILPKMDRIAQEYKLKGYEYTDLTLLQAFYYRYVTWFYVLGISVSVFFFLFLHFRFLRSKTLKNTFFVIFFMFLGVYLGITYLMQAPKQVIIAKPNSYLMKAPSAGSEVYKIVEAGHRLVWKSTQDTWLEVLWDNQPCYIKRSDVFLLDF